MGNLSTKKFKRLLILSTTDEKKRRIIYYRCATDIKFFAKYFFPHYCSASFNKFHEDSFQDYKFQERGVRRVSAAPRGYAKTTIKGFIKLVHDICYKLEKFILIISNTEPQAKQKLKDIRSEFLDNKRLLAVYSGVSMPRKIGEKDYVVSNGSHKIRLLALGSKTEIRGIRFGDSRPTKVLCDDLEHSIEVENEEIRDKYEALFADVISKVGTKHTNIDVIGTILHRKALLVKILRNPAYSSRQYKAVISWADRKDLWEKWKDLYCDLDDEGRKEKSHIFFEKNKEEMLKGSEVLWEDYESYLDLQKEIVETGYRSFMKEKQNSPLSDDEKIFDPENFKYFHEVDSGLKVEKSGVVIPWKNLTSFGVIDPATGQTKAKKGKKGDFTCILSGYEDHKGRLFVTHDYTKRVAPTKYIEKIFELHNEFDYQEMGVETNLYRNLLIPNMQAERKRIENKLKKIIKLSFYDIEQTENKEKRIYTLEPKVSMGWILFSRNLSNEFYDQLWEFPKGDHDDCPDALEMLWSLVHNRSKYSKLPKNPRNR